MKLVSTLLASGAALLAASCVGYGYDYGYGYGYGPGPVRYYDGYYDGYYGPIYSGYWGPRSVFFFSRGHGRSHFRDDGRHFRRHSAHGFQRFRVPDNRGRARGRGGWPFRRS